MTRIESAAVLVVRHLADEPRTQNELYTWWAAQARDPADLRDAIRLLIDNERAIASKVGGTKLLTLASSKPAAPSAEAERPRTWTPGVKPRGQVEAVPPAPDSVAPAPPPRSVDWLTTEQAARVLGLSAARVKQFGNDGRLAWRHREGSGTIRKKREYSRASIEKLAELRARGALPRPASNQPGVTVAAEEKARPAPEPPEVVERPPLQPTTAEPPPAPERVALARFALAIPDQLVEYLEQLRRIGLYGDTVEAVAERLMCEALLRWVESPKLKLRGT